MKTVYSSIHLHEVLLAKTILDSVDIKSVIAEENIAAIAPHLILAIGGIRLMVGDNNYDTAKQILDECFKNTSMSLEREMVQHPVNIYKCPKCDSENIRILKTHLKLPSLIISLLLMYPIPIRKKCCQCKNCGEYWGIKLTCFPDYDK
ncbi:MAG: DUF2007 domain-containing protein [Candidatus Firestonebacteria bacterium]